MSLIKMPYEVNAEFKLKILLYGQPGIGKSTTALSMPKPVLIDCDNGVHRVRAEHRVPFLPVKNYDEVINVINSKDIEPFETIVIDTAGKLLDYMGDWIIKQDPKKGRKDGQLTMQGYGVRKYEFINLLKKVSLMNKHLVFVAHEKEEKDNDARYIRPDIGGSSGADLIKELDLVGYMEAIGRKRTISFSPSDKYYAKNSARLEDMFEVDELKDGKTNDFMSRIVTKCESVLLEESEQVVKYNALMKKLEYDIAAVVDAKSANKVLATLGKVEHIWDSKIKSWELLKKRAEENGLVFDAKDKTFTEVKNEKTISNVA